LDVINSVIKADKGQQEKERLEKEIPTLERDLQRAKQSQVFPGAIALYRQQLDAAADELTKQNNIIEQSRLISAKAETILLSQWSQPQTQPQSQPDIKKILERIEKIESQMQDMKTQAQRSALNSSIPEDKIKAINHNFSKLRETGVSTTNNLNNIDGRLKTIEAVFPTLQRQPEASTGPLEARVQKLEKSTHTHAIRLGNIDVLNTKPYKNVEAHISELQDNVFRIQRDISQLERDSSKFDTDLKTVDKKHEDRIATVTNELKKANNELSEKLHPLESDMIFLKSQPRSTGGDAPSGATEASSSFTDHRLTTLEQELQAQGTEVQAQRIKIQGIMKIHENAQDGFFEELEKLENSIKSLKADYERTKEDVIRHNQDVPKIDQNNEDLVKKVELIHTSVSTLHNFHTKIESNYLHSNQQLQTELDNYRSACAGSIQEIEKKLDNYRSACAGSIEAIEKTLESDRTCLTSSVEKIRSDMATYCNNCSTMVNRLRNDLNEASKRIDTMTPAFQEAKKCTDLVTSHSVSLRSLEMRWSNITTGDLVKSMSDAMLEMGPWLNINQKLQGHMTETRNRFAALMADLAQLQPSSQLSPGEKVALATYPSMAEKVESLSRRVDPMQTTLDKLSDLTKDIVNSRQQSQLSAADKNALAECSEMSGKVNGLSQRVELMESSFNKHYPSLQKMVQEISHLSNKVIANEEMIISVDGKFDDFNHTEPSAELMESIQKIDPLIAKVDGHILELEQVKKDVAEFNRAEAERSNAGLQDFTDVNTRLSDLEASIPEPGSIAALFAEAEGSRLRDDMLEHRLAELGSKAEGIKHQLADLQATKTLAEGLRDTLDFLTPKIAALEDQYQAIEDEGIKLTDDHIKRVREKLAGEPIHTMLHRLRKAEDDIKQAFNTAGRQPEVRVLKTSSRTSSTSSPAQVSKPSPAPTLVPTLGVHIPVNSTSLSKDGSRASQLPGVPAQMTPPTQPGLSSGASSSSKSQSSLTKPANQQVQSLKTGTRHPSSGTPSEDERSTPAPSSSGTSPGPSGFSGPSKREKKEMKAKRKAEREAERDTRESSETKPKKKKVKIEPQS
jgi:chromosome segregation ATPase